MEKTTVEEQYFHLFSKVIREKLDYKPSGREFIEERGNKAEINGREEYRLGRFGQGLRIVEMVEKRFFKLDGKAVLDICCGFGGHISAIMSREVFCVGCDFVDYNYRKLKNALNNGPSKSSVHFLISDMNFLPLKYKIFDFIFSNGGLEHLPKLDDFLCKVGKILRRDGVAIFGFPVAIKCVLKDPHYKLPFISILPAKFRSLIAEKIFKKKYPWRVFQTFVTFSSFARSCSRQGLSAKPIISDYSRKYQLVQRMPFKGLWLKLIKEFCWDWAVIQHKTCSK